MVNLSFGGPNGLIQGFNWVFLLELIVVVIVVIFLLFYFNRVFGFVVSYAIRTVTWHRYKAYVHIEAIQLSFLAGRILFKDFRYQSRNQSIYILKGHLTWRYWIRKTRVRQNSQVKEEANSRLPCRIVLVVEGAEWFVYNRTPAYDAIIAAAEVKHKDRTSNDTGEGVGRIGTQRSSAERTSDQSLKQQDSQPPSHPRKKRKPEESTDESSWLLRLLPLQVICKKGSIIMGNNATPSIIVAQFVQADMSIDAAESRSKFDLYKMVYDCNFTRPTIQIKMNIDYKESLLTRASHIVEKAETKVPSRGAPSVWRTVRDLIPFFQESSESLARPQTSGSESIGDEETPWTGLPRYSIYYDADGEGSADALRDPLLRQTDVTDYAKVTTILDSAELQLTFYYDEPGRVPPISKQLPSDEIHIGNGDMSPQWGMDIGVTGATISYGPWADRQRGMLQEMFFPGTYEDATVQPVLNVGDRRVYAWFKVFVAFKDSVTFKIPTKETSKDWRYSTQYLRSSVEQRVTTRPFGWIEIKASSESTITYNMGLTPRSDGWMNVLDLELKRLRVTTSVNYGVFTEAEALRMRCDLSNPLKWDALHNWSFNITLFCPSIFLLRDHITLFSDCGNDWTSAASDYATWTPFIYTVNVEFIDFGLFLNVNDGNIISSPSDLNDNAYLAFRGSNMSGKVVLPSHKIKPVEHNVQFEWQCPSLALAVHAPLWNTLSALLSQQEVGQLHKFEMTGSYTYPSDVSRKNIETLDAQISAAYFSVMYYGFLLRYFFNVRNNYFGEYTQFMTLEEYQREAKLSRPGTKYGGGKTPISNVLDVIIAVEIKKGALILPSRLYEATEGIRMHFDTLQADVRFMDYYMGTSIRFEELTIDLQVNVTPVSCFHHLKEPIDKIFENMGDPQAFVDGLTVHAHRLLGNPPTNPAYICNWDFDIGMITGAVKIPFLQAINSAINSFVYNLDDTENALPDVSPPDRDITFVRVNAAGASLRIHVETEEIRVQIGPTTLGADDRTSQLRSSKSTVSIESFAIQILHQGKMVGSFNTALRLTVLGRRRDLLDHGPKQAKHVRDHDASSRRAWFLYSNKRGRSKDYLDAFEIDLPPLARERVDTIHRQSYTPRCTLEKETCMPQDIHLASAFLPPNYGTWSFAKKLRMTQFGLVSKAITPMQHSSYCDIVLANVNNLPATQKTFIAEVSADTKLLLAPDVIHSVGILFQAFETTDPVASLDAFQVDTVSELLVVKRDRSTVTFAKMIVPRIQIWLQGDDGLGLLIDLVDFAPQFRSVHYKRGMAEGDSTKPGESSISVIATLRNIDAIVCRHDFSTVQIPDTPESGKNDLAHISIQNVDVKVRQGLKIGGYVSVGDIEGTVNAQEIQTLSSSVDDWRTRASRLSSIIYATSQRRLCQSRNLVAAIVLEGDKLGVSNDPPFLTRPSHVLRISKNLLRIDDSWKISARVRHIARSLHSDAIKVIGNNFRMPTCNLVPMGPVMEILSRWRSWEISNIQESYFFRWITGVSGRAIEESMTGSVEGVLSLRRVVIHFDVKDGKANMVELHNVVINCLEQPEPSSNVKATNVMDVNVSCERFSVEVATDALYLVRTIKPQQAKDSEEPRQYRDTVKHSPMSTMEYRGSFLVNQMEISAQVANLGLSLGLHHLRLSGFSQLLDAEVESPSFCLSFRQLDIGLLEGHSQRTASHLSLKQFAAHWLLHEERYGLAASLGSITVRLLKPIPWLITEGTEALYAIKSNFIMDSDTEVASRSTFRKPYLPTVTFRLNYASFETWLVPDVLLIKVASNGFQTVLGELAENQQWGFLDIPPATFSLYQTTTEHLTLAEISTPFAAIKAVARWQEQFCKLDLDVQVGVLSVPMASLMALFQTLAADEVLSHLIMCQKSIDNAQKRLASSKSIVQRANSHRSSMLASYHVYSLWESIEIVADTPEAKVLFACSGTHISLSNRSTKPSQPERIQFTVGSRSTSLSLFPSDRPEEKLSLLDFHWDIGNSLLTDKKDKMLHRLYLVSNMFAITLSPRSVSRASGAVRYIVNEVDKLRVSQTLQNLDLGHKREISTHDNNDPFESLNNVEALRVCFSHIKFKWIANDRLDDSHGFTFHCKTLNASVLDRATRGRFVVEEGEVELNTRKTKVSANYARLPKLDFNVHRRTEADGWQLQLDAHGDTVQVNFTPAVIETGFAILESISAVVAGLRVDFPSDISQSRLSTSHTLLQQTQKLKAVVMSIDFSGAKINAQYDKGFKPSSYMSKYQVEGDGCDVGAMHIPGLALRSRYARKPRHVFHAEICVLQSSNYLSPLVKPFIHDIVHRLERVMSRRGPLFEEAYNATTSQPEFTTAAILGDLKFSVGLRVQSQELTLSCHPFSKVDANVGVDEIYATLISCTTANNGQAFAMTVTISGAHASLKHQYSGIASAKVKLNDLSLTVFNNEQIQSAGPGMSAILKSSAFEVSLNARQGQDFLIFNSLWLEGPPPDPEEELQLKRLSNPISMHQLQKVTASPPSFPINVTILVDEINFALDLGQSIGTTDLKVRSLRISNRKCSEYHHCVFFSMDSAEAESKGRFSGYMNTNHFMVQTSIYFQGISDQVMPTPLVQIDVKLGYVEFRASFEYHVFLIGDSANLRFTIYNRRVRTTQEKWGDRLIFLGDSEQIHLYATAEGPALVLSVYKALIQLKEEKEQSRAKELASFNEASTHLPVTPPSPRQRPSLDLSNRISVARVDMEMSIKFAKINIGIFKAALNDSPVFRVNVANIRALFSQTVSSGTLENRLQMALGTLGIALSPLRRMGGKELGEMKVEKWIKHVSSMRGGVILGVPETEGSMWTKQEEGSDVVEHIFKSRLDGKVDIGWNYGSVMYVQELWKTFELKLRQFEEARARDVPEEEEESTPEKIEEEMTSPKEKVGVDSKEQKTSGRRPFTYFAVEPAIVETPQLRQMGEATPPMEWIGVNRMRLPVFTHQAFIVPLQQVSRRVEVLYNLTLQREAHR